MSQPLIRPQVGDEVCFVLTDGSGHEHVGTVVDLFEDPADGLYVTTGHVAHLSITLDEVRYIVTRAGA